MATLKTLWRTDLDDLSQEQIRLALFALRLIDALPNKRTLKDRDLLGGFWLLLQPVVVSCRDSQTTAKIRSHSFTGEVKIGCYRAVEV